jgi:short-subunit dehydrogenase
VITGASSGFGKGAAREFARAGASLALAARRGQLLDELAQEIRQAGGRAIAVQADVSVADDVEKLADAALTEYGHIDVWVNNAGAGAIGRFEEIPLSEHVQVIETDLLGTLYGSYFAMRHFRKRGEGTLINMASVVGKVPAPYYSSYAAAKHGVVGLSAALRQELKENNVENIHVSTILPTSMDTPFFDHASTFTGHESMPIPPVYEPQEVIDAIVRMARDPEDEVVVGTAGKFFAFAHKIAPGLVESMMARQTHKAEIEKAPPQSETGTITQPKATGTEVSGGWKK